MKNQEIVELLPGDSTASFKYFHHPFLSLSLPAMFNLWGIMKKVTGIAKIEMFYMAPFGPSAWLAGISFIDRKSPKASYKTLSACADRMKNEDVSICYFIN